MVLSRSGEVLRCELCSKPFDKEASLKRHSYYCRDKKGTGRKNRNRSCGACVKAKTRCDSTRPRCARCVARHLSCAYPSASVNSRSMSSDDYYRRHRLDDVGGTVVPDVSTTPLFSNPATEPLEAAVDLTNVRFESTSLGLPDWGLPHSDLSYTNKWGPIVLPLYQDQHRQRTGWMDHVPIAKQSGMHSIPRMPDYHLRSFTQSKSTTGRASPSATFMSHVLTSFPRMMYNPGSLPPFIHPYSLGDNAHNPNDGFETLVTCATLMQIVSSGAPGSRKLFWKNVRLECERLQVEMLTFDKWNLLSAMQALTIYILVRLQEGERPENNHDVLLLSTLWVVACALNDKLNFGSCIARSGLYYGSGRSEWIFEESRRRLAIVYQVLKMLYSLDPATSCAEPDGFLLAPLPGRKQLWEASNAQIWAVEKSRDGLSPVVFGVLTGGEMVRLQELQVIMPNDIDFLKEGGEEQSTANWQEWCGGMDGLGALVTLAVSLSAA